MKKMRIIPLPMLIVGRGLAFTSRGRSRRGLLRLVLSGAIRSQVDDEPVRV